MTYKRNISGLLTSAKKRHESTLQRAITAIDIMKKQNEKINFNTIAKKSGVSIAWLYREPKISHMIKEAKIETLSFGPKHEPLKHGNNEIIITELKNKIKNLKIENMKLHKQLEVVYGELHKLQCNS